MFPTLGHMLSYLTGNDITLGFPTFGLLVALSFVAAATVLSLELKRKEKVGLFKSWKEKFTIGEKPTIVETLGNALFGFLIGYKLIYAFQNNGAFAENPASIIISLQGNLLWGIIFAVAYAGYSYYKKNRAALATPEIRELDVHPYQLVANITIVAAISGIIGAKVFHNLENWNDFVADPIGGLTSFSGLTFFGGLIFGAAAVLWYVRKRGMNGWSVADSVAPGLILAYALGRLGCQLSGDGDWGVANTSPKPSWLSWAPDWVWSFTYPHNVSQEGVPIPGCIGEYCNELAVPVWPTPIYETLMGLIIFAILWAIRKKIDFPGMMISAYLFFAGIERLLIEQIRVNTGYDKGLGITQAEFIAATLIVLGATGLFFFWNRRKKTQINKVI